MDDEYTRKNKRILCLKLSFFKYFSRQSVKTPSDFIYFFKPLKRWNINLDTGYNIPSLLAHLKIKKKKIYVFFTKYQNEQKIPEIKKIKKWLIKTKK